MTILNKRLYIRQIQVLSYDNFHRKNEIVRVVGGNPAEKESFAGTPSPLGRLLNENFPEVRSYSRFYLYHKLIRVENMVFNENRVAAADSGFFDIFSFPLVKGDKNMALTKYNSVLLSEATANKYFGDKDPLGKTIIFNDSILYEITGIFKDIPANSHIHFDLLVPFKSLHVAEDWGAWNYYTYLLFSSNTQPFQFKEKTVKWAEKINGASVSEIMALMSRNYIWWVVISFIAACPPAILIIGKWLQNFAYRTELNWWIFALAGIIALVIALLTVILQSWKVATKNPIDALRYE